MLLADSTAQQVFGTIRPVGPANTLTLSFILSWGLRLFFFALGMLALYYMLMGAFEWVNSAGEEKKLESAKQKITQSAVGLLIAIAILVGWWFLSSQILGIFKNGSIRIPSINCIASGTTYTNVSDCCSQTDDTNNPGKCL